MNPFKVSKAFFYITILATYLTALFSAQIQFWSKINYQIVWAIIGTMMLGSFLNMIILLHDVLVLGEKHLNVSTVLRESGLYQMEAIE